MTSPTVTASRLSGSRNTSYQSPPTSVDLGRYLASRTKPRTLGNSSGSRLRCSVTAAVCSFSYISARSTASAHWPASASRKTRSSSRIVRGVRNENRSAPSGIPAASSGSPTQACSSPVSRTGPAPPSASGSDSNWARNSSGSAISTGRLVAIARVITLGVSSVSRTPAASGRPAPGRSG